MSVSNEEIFAGSAGSRTYELRYLRDTLDAHQRAAEQLQTALENSRLVGVACGVVLATLKTTQDNAFGILSSASQAANCRLVSVARYVVDTGAVPTPSQVMPSVSREAPSR